MSKTTQISAVISASTKELLERYTRATGMKKGHLLEDALLHHIHALQELPADIVVPARIVVSKESGKRMLQVAASPTKPTRELRRLLSDDRD